MLRDGTKENCHHKHAKKPRKDRKKKARTSDDEKSNDLSDDLSDEIARSMSDEESNNISTEIDHGLAEARKSRAKQQTKETKEQQRIKQRVALQKQKEENTKRHEAAKPKAVNPPKETESACKKRQQQEVCDYSFKLQQALRAEVEGKGGECLPPGRKECSHCKEKLWYPPFDKSLSSFYTGTLRLTPDIFDKLNLIEYDRNRKEAFVALFDPTASENVKLSTDCLRKLYGDWLKVWGLATPYKMHLKLQAHEQEKIHFAEMAEKNEDLKSELQQKELQIWTLRQQIVELEKKLAFPLPALHAPPLPPFEFSEPFSFLDTPNELPVPLSLLNEQPPSCQLVPFKPVQECKECERNKQECEEVNSKYNMLVGQLQFGMRNLNEMIAAFRQQPAVTTVVPSTSASPLDVGKEVSQKVQELWTTFVHRKTGRELDTAPMFELPLRVSVGYAMPTSVVGMGEFVYISPKEDLKPTLDFVQIRVQTQGHGLTGNFFDAELLKDPTNAKYFYCVMHAEPTQGNAEKKLLFVATLEQALQAGGCMREHAFTLFNDPAFFNRQPDDQEFHRQMADFLKPFLVEK